MKTYKITYKNGKTMNLLCKDMQSLWYNLLNGEYHLEMIKIEEVDTYEARRKIKMFNANLTTLCQSYFTTKGRFIDILTDMLVTLTDREVNLDFPDDSGRFNEEIDNFWLTVTWYKMPGTGNFEFIAYVS